MYSAQPELSGQPVLSSHLAIPQLGVDHLIQVQL